VPALAGNRERGVVEQPDAADEAGASDGASPLIWVFYGRQRGLINTAAYNA